MQPIQQQLNQFDFQFPIHIHHWFDTKNPDLFAFMMDKHGDNLK
jgi:hypothetical protein